ncbi:MAG: intradiol ring-cleavage dioxygenase [Acidobacteriota bacterium]|nr:MAG: intradiol ring-cleavage dioxygenase [Acidobacteriota bacterium]
MDGQTRRRFIQTLGAGSLAWYLTPGAFAQELVRTPRQTEGPFYPDNMPLDTDNDLLILNDAITPAVGAITHLTGRILSPSGEPIRNAVVEIWQVDHNGAYIHSKDTNRSKRDTNFQGFGRFLTASTGEYYFRTIKPVPYPGRTPHIHVAILQGGKRMLTTQLYIKGEPQNEKDGIYRSITDSKARASITIPFMPIRESKIGELSARFDIVIGQTPEDPSTDSFRRRS